MVIVAIPLVAFMPWSGTPETEQYSGEPTALISPSPILTLAPETEETDYIPDAAEVEALAKMLYGEARGIASDMEKAACVWCVLNRVDDPRFPDTVLEVLEAPYPLKAEVTDRLLFCLGIRQRANPELRYFVTLAANYDANEETILKQLRRRRKQGIFRILSDMRD